MNIKNIIILISLYLLLGCSSISSKNKDSGLVKSPCACLDSEFIDVNNNEIINV